MGVSRIGASTRIISDLAHQRPIFTFLSGRRWVSPGRVVATLLRSNSTIPLRPQGRRGWFPFRRPAAIPSVGLRPPRAAFFPTIASLVGPSRSKPQAAILSPERPATDHPEEDNVVCRKGRFAPGKQRNASAVCKKSRFAPGKQRNEAAVCRKGGSHTKSGKV